MFSREKPYLERTLQHLQKRFILSRAFASQHKTLTRLQLPQITLIGLNFCLSFLQVLTTMAEHAAAMAAAVPVAAPGKRGRKPATFWTSFTTAAEPYKLRAAVCRHCQELVRHHKKSEQARCHLMKCAAFLHQMAALAAHEQPDWYVTELQKRQKVLHDRALAATAGAGGGAPRSTGAVHDAKINKSTATTTPSKEAAKLTRKDSKRMEDCLAMHLFATMGDSGFAEPWTDASFLAQALVASNRSAALPDEKRLMSVLLDRCYSTLKRRINKFLAGLPLSVALSLDESPSSTSSERVMNYIAATGGKHLFLESVHFPTATEHNQAEWTASDISRVIGSATGAVAGCVTASLTTETRRAWELLQLQFPAMFFHGCLRSALETLLCDLLAPVEGDISSLTRELQQCAADCRDLEDFLPDGQGDEDYSRVFKSPQGSKSKLANVTFQPSVTKLLTVEAAVTAILRAEFFLNADNVRYRLFPSAASHPRGADVDTAAARQQTLLLQQQLVDHVASAEFTQRLRKCLAVVGPIAHLAALFVGDAPLPISDVYPRLRALAVDFAEHTELDESDKLQVQALVQRQYDVVVGNAHLLAYALDPVHAGQELPPETKAQVEHQLLAFPSPDGSARDDAAKEALYLQYTDFQIAALHLRSTDAFVLRMLTERKKSPLQYWLTDGAKWPTLQAVACRAFAMPACAVDSARELQPRGFSLRRLRDRFDSRTAEKLVFVRANARELAPLTAAGGSSASSASLTSPLLSPHAPLATRLLDDADSNGDALLFPETAI